MHLTDDKNKRNGSPLKGDTPFNRLTMLRTRHLFKKGLFAAKNVHCFYSCLLHSEARRGFTLWRPKLWFLLHPVWFFVTEMRTRTRHAKIFYHFTPFWHLLYYHHTTSARVPIFAATDFPFFLCHMTEFYISLAKSLISSWNVWKCQLNLCTDW